MDLALVSMLQEKKKIEFHKNINAGKINLSINEKLLFWLEGR